MPKRGIKMIPNRYHQKSDLCDGVNVIDLSAIELYCIELDLFTIKRIFQAVRFQKSCSHLNNDIYLEQICDHFF